MELLGKLGIDLKLLLAQIINFLVLLWLLRLVLYKPLVKKLEERTKKAKEIEDGLRDLQRRKEEMKKKEEEMIRETKEKTRRIIAESKEISEEEFTRNGGLCDRCFYQQIPETWLWNEFIPLWSA